jgi:ABC-type Fe3+/spermidine/putrescine transport system ATPase subunit
MNDFIQISQVRKRFPEFSLAVDFSIKQGEILSLLGPSGCGKSTSLSLINGILTPDEGDIFVAGEKITDLPIWQRNIGYVFQDYALFPHMNVRENIGYSLRVAKYSKKRINSRVDELLELIQLEEYGLRKVNNLSGGERQRVALARAVASEPKLLLLDEPLSALDAKLRVTMRKEIQRIQKDLGLTMLYVTHDQEEAMAISDRIAVMNRGSIEQVGTPEEIYHYPRTLFAADFIGTSNVLEDTEQHTSLIFRPEHVIIEQRKLQRASSMHLRDAQLMFQEFAGRWYECTFSYRHHEITAYSTEKLQLNEAYQLYIEQDNIQII